MRRPVAASRLEHDRPHFPGSPFGLHADGSPGDASPVLSWQHHTERVPSPGRIARRLGLAGGDLVTRTRYLLTADGNPVQVATSHEPTALTRHTDVAFPEEGPLAGRGVVERMRAAGVSVEEVVEDISARPCLAAEASALRIPAGAPVFVVEREHRAGRRVVEFGEIVIPAARYRLRYRVPVTGPGSGLPIAATA